MQDRSQTSGRDQPTSNPWTTQRTRDQRWAEADLARHPYRIELRGAPGSVTWPDLCAHCGGHAAERIRIRRAFYRRGRRSYRGPFGYRVVSAPVPFCGSCAARHREAAARVSWFRRYRWFLFNPAHIATIGFGFLLAMMLPAASSTSMADSSGKVAWGLAGICVFGMVWTIAVTWWMSRPDRFEPITEITSACTISNDVSQFFEGRRHIYGFDNQPFAQAFERANQGHLWTGADQVLMWKKSLVRGVLLLVLLGGARLLLWLSTGR